MRSHAAQFPVTLGSGELHTAKQHTAHHAEVGSTGGAVPTSSRMPLLCGSCRTLMAQFLSQQLFNESCPFPSQGRAHHREPATDVPSPCPGDTLTQSYTHGGGPTTHAPRHGAADDPLWRPMPTHAQTKHVARAPPASSKPSGRATPQPLPGMPFKLLGGWMIYFEVGASLAVFTFAP